MVKVTLQTDGSLDVLITGVDSAIITSIAYAQNITPEELLQALIQQSALFGTAGKLGQPALVK